MSLIFDDRNVAQILDDAIIANPQIKQKDIAEAAGFEKPNVIYMFKKAYPKFHWIKLPVWQRLLALMLVNFGSNALRNINPTFTLNLNLQTNNLH